MNEKTEEEEEERETLQHPHFASPPLSHSVPLCVSVQCVESVQSVPRFKQVLTSDPYRTRPTQIVSIITANRVNGMWVFLTRF